MYNCRKNTVATCSPIRGSLSIIIITRWSIYSSPYLNNKMNIQRPTPWSSILQFSNKTWTDIDRRIIVMAKLGHWSEFNCFHRTSPTPRFKTCQCLESLHGSDGRKNCVIDYILFWARLDKVPRQMIVIEKLKVLNDKKNNKKPFIIPFVPCQLI